MSALVKVSDAASFLASLDQAKRYLAACSDVGEAKTIRDKAGAVLMWARAQKDAGELEVAAGEIRVLATIRMGELLPAKATKSEAGSKGGRGKLSEASTAFTRDEARVARAVFAVPAPVRERVVEEAKARGEAPTITAVLRAGKEAARRAEAATRAAPSGSDADPPLTTDDLDGLVARGRKFATIYADPPWSYSNQGTRGTMANHYNGMSLSDICALPIAALAEDNAHLHLWATSPLLPEALEVMKAWGFVYKSSLVWAKSVVEQGERTGRIGMGNYWRIDHEFLLLGIRGRLPFAVHDQRSVVEHLPGKHSSKPDAFRAIVERVSPGPRLELFGRDSGTSSPGWVVWGDQIPRTLFARAVKEAGEL